MAKVVNCNYTKLVVKKTALSFVDKAVFRMRIKREKLI